MITLIIGGSGSGKSEYAEQIAVESAKEKGGSVPLLYIATMQPFGTETLQKIARHHRLRKDKGFTTIEQYVDIEMAADGWEKDSIVLLECMSNLLANERYRPDYTIEAGQSNIEVVKKVVQGILVLEQSCRHLVIVTNDVFASGETYDADTMEYINQLGQINVQFAAKADNVVEVVCAIPIVVKR